MKRWHFDNCSGPTKRFKARVTLNGERICLGKFLTKKKLTQRKKNFIKQIQDLRVIFMVKSTLKTKQKMRQIHAGHAGAIWSDESRKKLSDKRNGSLNPFFEENTQKKL